MLQLQALTCELCLFCPQFRSAVEAESVDRESESLSKTSTEHLTCVALLLTGPQGPLPPSVWLETRLTHRQEAELCLSMVPRLQAASNSCSYTPGAPLRGGDPLFSGWRGCYCVL